MILTISTIRYDYEWLHIT